MLEDILSDVFDGNTATLMARILDWSGNVLTVENTLSVTYTIWNTSTNAAVSGHTAVSVTPSACLYDTLQTPEIWTADDTGFNFAWTPDVSTNPAFGTGDGTAVGLIFLVVFTIQPTSGQALLIRFRLNVI